MRPVTRDVCIYLINVSVLVAIVFDGQIAWYEATVLGVMYVCYFLIMFNSVRLFALADRLTDRWRNRNKDGKLSMMRTNVRWRRMVLTMSMPLLHYRGLYAYMLLYQPINKLYMNYTLLHFTKFHIKDKRSN